MSKILPDDILEGMYKLRTRESEKLKTELELYDLEIHQKKLGPDYHRLKIMVKRSIEQDIRNKNFGTWNGNYEKNAVVKNQETNSVDRILGDCWQLEANGQCSKGDNCSFRHDVNKRAENDTADFHLRILSCSRMKEKHRKPEVPEERVPSGGMSFDGHARITSKELALIHHVKKWQFPERVVADLGISALMHIARLMNSLAKGPKRMMTQVQWPCWRRMIGAKMYGNLLSTLAKVTKDRGDPQESWSWVETRTYWTSIIECTTIGLRISGHGAAEVVINLAEELRRAETNPTCKIHESYCTPH